MADIEMHLAQLLGNMSIGGRQYSGDVESEGLAQTVRPLIDESDAPMSESSDTENTTYRQLAPLASSGYTAIAGERPPCGCALVQAIRGQMCTGGYPTTGGEYLETIFTHREALYTYPDGHRTCAIGFTDLAMDLERREMRADRDADAEAAAAFRHEAWVIASSGSW
ncbi:hypothetical protein WOLCODRAFT_108823 [Wolfiporia cocos MD-104 SS10]|uniref:Uncharacterized protein n=1 Tax=Wolfiporia cocos (strain MD-104) TaxID=742152 RepID=A0A2H3J2Q7_WOLCO|nr:hypothetical protein WOLCODRAFT_108823 [Wolfiporia cocos MD-104 SS10]